MLLQLRKTHHSSHLDGGISELRQLTRIGCGTVCDPQQVVAGDGVVGVMRHQHDDPIGE